MKSKTIEITETTIFKMSLHDRVKLNSMLYVLRVPGGWIYETRYKFNDEVKINLVFVPYSENINNPNT